VDAPECSQKGNSSNRARSGIVFCRPVTAQKSDWRRYTTGARCARGRPDPDFPRAVRALLNVAIYAVVALQSARRRPLHSQLPSRSSWALGCSLVLAAFFLCASAISSASFAYSSIEHMGIITFAFGMGGQWRPSAHSAYDRFHSLTKSASFFAGAMRLRRPARISWPNIRGLITLSPTVRLGLMMGSLAILGMPPFGGFLQASSSSSPPP